MIRAVDARYDLFGKTAKERGVEEVFTQIVARKMKI